MRSLGPTELLCCRLCVWRFFAKPFDALKAPVSKRQMVNSMLFNIGLGWGCWGPHGLAWKNLFFCAHDLFLMLSSIMRTHVFSVKCPPTSQMTIANAFIG